MKNILWTLLLLGVITPHLFAQGANNIIGLYVEVEDDNGMAPPDYEMWLSSINTQTGDINQISNQGFGNYISNKTSTVDPIQDIFYYTDGSGQIVAIDEQTGDILFSSTMQLQPNYYFQQFVYNELDQNIYGLERTPTQGGKFYLSTIDPQTGVITRISNNSIANTICNLDMALDVVNDVYYFSDCTDLIGVDLNTGSIVNQVPLSIPNADYFSHFKFNMADGMIYGVSRTANPAGVYLAKLNPQTGVVTNISQQSVASSVNINDNALDPLNEIFYIKSGSSNLLSIDMDTGNVLNQPSINSGQGIGFKLIYYRNSKILLDTEDFSNQMAVDFYPIPADYQINVVTNQKFESYEIYDINGKLIQKDSFSTSLNIESINQGIYFIKLNDFDGDFFKKKIIIK